MNLRDGGVCIPHGFRAAGVAAGIKGSGELDLALIVSEEEATAAAGVFTTNRSTAAPVQVSRARLAGGRARGVVINSGCANAMTGPRGVADAELMAASAAAAVGVGSEEMLVCSTGLIGAYLPMEAVLRGIEEAAGRLGEGDEAAARAIMTTDTRPKRAALVHPDGWSVGGIAKGAGMMAPRMATMLAVITTDARLSAADLDVALRETTEGTFNSITVDGDTSTNDTVLVFANGRCGVAPSLDAFGEALHAVCAALAKAIVSDGEGATKLVRVRISGGISAEQAKLAARAVAESLLVKTALYGADANWGRVAAAIGRSGAEAAFDRLSISMGGVGILLEGIPAPQAVLARARDALGGEEVEIACDLQAGSASAEMLTTDLSP
ncbi:MAG: bifunctional glutamate N-acetyltransferase/amino-acid acetyltransferase ArgJ, partial [Actinomycetota bacterium]